MNNILELNGRPQDISSYSSLLCKSELTNLCKWMLFHTTLTQLWLALAISRPSSAQGGEGETPPPPRVWPPIELELRKKRACWSLREEADGIQF